MTHKEYEEFKKDFADFMEREGLDNLSLQSDCNEPYFSWRACVVCGAIAGDRYDCNGYSTRDKEVKEYEGVCQDCVYFAEYGQLDDQTINEMDL
jgi:hypothetical protein